MTTDERREAAGELLVKARGPRPRAQLAQRPAVSPATLAMYESGWREQTINGEKVRTPANIPEVRLPDIARVYGVAEAALREILGYPPRDTSDPTGTVGVPEGVRVHDKGPGQGLGVNRVVVRREGLEVEAVYTDAEDRAQVLADIFAAMNRHDVRTGEDA